MSQRLSKREFDSLKNKQPVFQKSDKGNSIVIVKGDKYIKKSDNFLSDRAISENYCKC